MVDKKDMTEEEIKYHYITPAIEATWNRTSIRMEFPVTLGRIIIDGKKTRRDKKGEADYLLFHNDSGSWFPLAVVEAKNNNHTVLGGMGFVREGFYDYENVVENVVERFSDAANKLLNSYSKKKCETAKKILSTIARDNSVTIAQIAGTAEINDRTVQRYLKEFQDAGILRREGSDTDGKWILM